ncbi:MAG TPA: hypothetical protein ENK54_04355 [Thiotrichales bacterium]|nr:hypothetical protein [Thiotrichales bacterium]
MYLFSSSTSRGIFAALTLTSLLALGVSSPGLAGGQSLRGAIVGDVSGTASPASEGRSKTTGRRKPREIVVVGSGASARPAAPEAPARPLTHKAQDKRGLPHLPILTGDNVAAPKGSGTRANLPHDEILTGDWVLATGGGAGGLAISGTVLRDRPRAPRVPFFSQLGQTPVAEVPMQPVSCGPNCTEWKLATAQGKLGIEAKVGMSCPAGAAVTYLAYQPNDSQNTTVVFQGPPGGNTKSLWKTVVAKPFTAARLEQACDEALQQYPLGQAPVVEKLIKTKVNARGQCSDSITTYERQYPVTLRLRCVPPPPVG